MKGVGLTCTLLTAAVVAALLVSGGLPALAYAIIFVLSMVPGIPLGVRLFGRRHAAAWIGGGLLGYGLTELTLWAVIQAGIASTWTIVGAWLLACVASAVISKGGDRPAIAMPEWTRADMRALALALLLVPALMGPPYANLGRADQSGNRYYRAYFTADFVWHSALAYELGKFSLPPRNPYMAPRVMNYYWTYFLLPASVAQLAPNPGLQDVQRCLKANAMLVGLLMIGALFLLVRSAVSHPWAAAAAVSLAVVAASAEGTYAVFDLIVRGRSLDALLDTNIDAVTAWQFGGLRIDNVPRSLWYTPQHTTSVALGLIALLVAAHAGARASWRAIAGAGLALGLATTMNPLLGVACSTIYGACVLADAASVARGWTPILRHALAAGFVLLAIAWGTASRVMDGAGSALDFGFTGFSTNSPVLTLLLSLGPVLVPALAGLLQPRLAPRRPVVIAVAGIGIGLFLLYLVRISEASWVGFRAGQVLLVSIPILLARVLEWVRSRTGTLLAIGILAIGLPTTLIDTWNAQDIGNRRPGPGFRWTLWITPAQQQAFAWLRANTPADAIVQMEPMVRAREHWTLIPSFAGRRMAAGLPISLLPLPEYTERSERVRTLFATGNVDEAVAVARRLRIDYLYVDRDDVAAYPDGVRKFDEHPERFERVFANDEVKVYRVL